MSTKVPEIGTRVMGLLNLGGRGTCLSFATVTGHRREEGSRTVVAIEVEHDGGELDSYRMSTYPAYWEFVTDHRVSAADVQPVRGEGWQARFGRSPVRATHAEAVEDARQWWAAKAEPKKA